MIEILQLPEFGKRDGKRQNGRISIMWDGDMEQLEKGDWSIEDAELMYVVLKISKLETVVWRLRRWLSEEV